jgi:D-glycero-alpha-D-manno-heptose-7-phosphate kinase
VRPSLVARAPTRLDFGGGWTDVPPYPEERGGFVCNLAIERRATVRIAAATKSSPHAPSSIPLITFACEHAGVRDVQVDLSSDFPVGAGLGGSSAAGVALAAALARWSGRLMAPSQLAEWSRAVEVAGLQMAGGRQDHYAAAYGGALALTFGAHVGVRPLALAPTTCAELERRLLLVYTGESRISGETISAVLSAYQSRVPRVVDALERMKLLAVDMAAALETGDVNALGALVAEHWVHQRAMHPRISTERIDAIAQAATRAGALSLKALGASGGGCVVIIAPEEGAQEIERAIGSLGQVLPWRMAHTGVETAEEIVGDDFARPLADHTSPLPNAL